MMNVGIIKKYDNGSITLAKGKNYKPVVAVIGKKIYTIDNWYQFFKMMMYFYCYKCDRMDKIMADVNKPFYRIGNRELISDKYDESRTFAKFSPKLCVAVFADDVDNIAVLDKLCDYVGRDEFQLYIAEYCEDIDSIKLQIEIDSIVEELKNKKYRVGSAKHLVAHINGKILSDREKLFLKIEKQFDSKTFIGDIEINEKEERILKKYMHEMIAIRLKSGRSVHRKKVFSYGLVRVALKYYASKTYWPFLNQEYSVSADGNNIREKIFDIFRKTMLESGKPFDDSQNNTVQNICMHALVCNKCADQFFDYIFDFWRLDLSKSVENSFDEEGNDIFETLVEEINSNKVQDIMLHTSMALKANPVGCKVRFRRILRMIDDSYWNNTNYSSSKNRLTILFNEWINKPNGDFAKEIQGKVRSKGNEKGQKLLTKPTMVFDQAKSKFSIFLPRELLRGCNTNENPKWYVTTEKKRISIEPKLLEGRAFLFTEPSEIDLEDNELFGEINIVLKSERTDYYKKCIKQSDFRVFNNKNVCLEITDSYISKDVSQIYVNKGKKISCLNRSALGIDKNNDNYDIYSIYPREGDIFIFPDEHAYSIGTALKEGIIGSDRVSDVRAIYGNNVYEIASKQENIFFKTTSSKLNGTSIKIYKNDTLLYFKKVVDTTYTEFKIDDNVNDIYGYIINLSDYFVENGIYKIELSIPSLSIRTYKVCYIKGFEYRFVNAPYIFKSRASISIPTCINIETNDDWRTSLEENRLDFSLEEYVGVDREENPYVKNNELSLNCKLIDDLIELRFKLPVLYWKFSVEEPWSWQHPNDVALKDVPNRIYVDSGLDLSNAKMYIEGGSDIDDNEISINLDKDSGLLYFKTIDLSAYLNREQYLRKLMIKIGDVKELFLNISCGSFVRSHDLSGDFKTNKIYGYFDICGLSDYSVTVKYDGNTIDEDIPLVDGKFEIDCDVKEGKYVVFLYELEEDDSGFGLITYEIEKYDLDIVDVRKHLGSRIEIRGIRDREEKYPTTVISGYAIKDLKLLDWDSDIADNYDIYCWRDIQDELENFVYYEGTLIYKSNDYDKDFINLGQVLVIFDDPHNTNEVMINTINNNECGPLLFSTKRSQLLSSEEGLSKYEKKQINAIDDDVYKIKVGIRR